MTPLENKNSNLRPKEIDEAIETSIYYGFSPIETPVIGEIDRVKSAKLIKEDSIKQEHIVSRQIEMSLEEKNYLLRYYLEKNLVAEHQPIMFSYKTDENSNKQKKVVKNQFLNLQILGSSKSISEIVLIKTAIAILSDNGIKDICVNINSIGDKESTNKFVRELNSYYRKNINKMTSYCRQLFKKDVFLLLECDKKECCVKLNEEAPKAISFLSEPSRQYFKEVLEGLEILDIPYRINNNLIPDRRHSSQTIFEIVKGDGNNKEIVASGGRYDGLAKKIGFKKDIPAIGLKMFSKNFRNKKLIRPIIKKPDFFFLQLGFEAKLKSLNVIEILRKSRILIYQSLNRDMLVGQLALAEKMKISYSLIMGKKESMENTVMVRNMNTRSQETIFIDNLFKYLKSLKK